MNILRRFINQVFTPQKVEATPENVAKWEKKSARMDHPLQPLRPGGTLREIRHPLQIGRQEKELCPLSPLPQMVVARHFRKNGMKQPRIHHQATLKIHPPTIHFYENTH